jgi:hypothetical protein
MGVGAVRIALSAQGVGAPAACAAHLARADLFGICHLWPERDCADWFAPCCAPVCPLYARSRFPLRVTGEISYILLSEVMGYKSHLLDTGTLFSSHPVR